MPDVPVAGRDGGPYDPAMETRVARLVDDMRETCSAIARLEATTVRIETMLAATLPHLATKADLAEKPSKAYMWGVLAVLLTAYACGLAGLAVVK
jgi:ferric-dicitrate binding protein FerR (iron transport regulator)